MTIVSVVSRAMMFAILIMCGYTVAKVQVMEDSFDKGLAAVADEISGLKASIASMSKDASASAAEVSALRKEISARQEAEQLRKNMLASLRKAKNQIVQADSLREAGRFDEAIAQLLATKDVIWRAGDYYADHQTALRGLMEPIDINLAKWRGGDRTATAGAIIAQLETIIAQIGAE